MVPSIKTVVSSIPFLGLPFTLRVRNEIMANVIVIKTRILPIICKNGNVTF